MKISIRNLWSLMCVLVLLAAEVSPASELPTLTAGMIGKVTYLLGQAEITSADGSVSPLALQMEIPDGSRITVKERSRVSLLMIDGGIEKLGADTIFTFNKYTYDPDDPAATEIRKTLLDGEVTSTTGQGGEDAKERYRMNSPLAAIAVLGTEYTVKVSKGETWVTVHSGEISIAKLGGSCQRSGLGACAGGERLSEGQRGLALVVRAGDPKPILMPATAIPISENKAETPPPPVKEAEKESAKSEQAASSEKPAEPEAQKSTQASTPAATPAPASPASTTDTAQIAEKATSSPEPKATEKAASPAPVTEKPPVAVAAADERNPVGTSFAAKAVSAVESTSVSTSERTQSVALESVAPALTTPQGSVSPQPTSTGSSTTTTKAKQSLVQSSNSIAISSATEKVSVAPAVTTTPAVEAVPAKPAVVTVTPVLPVVTPAVEAVPVKPTAAVVTPVAEPLPEKPKTETVIAAPSVVAVPAVEPVPVPVVPEKPKEATVTAIVTPVVTPVVTPAVEPIPVKPTAAVVTPVAEPAPEKPKTETVVAAPSVVAVPTVEPVPAVPETPKEATVTAIVTPVVTPVVDPIPVTPAVAVVTATPAVELELPAPTVNWGKYDPTATVDGKTSFSEQVGSSYTQLLQPATASPSNPVLQQNPIVSLPEPDKGDVDVALDSAAAPVASVAATVNNADAGKTTPLSSSASTLRNDDATPQTPLITAEPLIAVPAAPLASAPLVTAPLTATTSTGLSVEAILDRTSDSPLTPVTPPTLTPLLANP